MKKRNFNKQPGIVSVSIYSFLIHRFSVECDLHFVQVNRDIQTYATAAYHPPWQQSFAFVLVVCCFAVMRPKLLAVS